jgi:hypothetical protein
MAFRPALLLAGAMLSLAEPGAHSLAPHARGLLRRPPAARPVALRARADGGSGEQDGGSGEQSGEGGEDHSRRGGLVSSSRSMLLCYAVASVVNAAVLFVAALAVSYVRSTDLPTTFSAVYVAAGTFMRPGKVALALAMVPFARRRTDNLGWLRFGMLFAPLFGVNLLITCFAHGTAAKWVWERALQPLWVRARS